jgi:IclR family transcriptional regulator, acetate operon repressor
MEHAPIAARVREAPLSRVAREERTAVSHGREPDSGQTGADRVLVALKLLADHPRAVRLEEFTRELGAPKSTTHRILVTLRRAGLVEQDEDDRYALSLEFLRLALRYYESLDERNIVQSTVQTLADRFGETAYYAKLDGSEVAYLSMVTAPPGYLHTATLVGARQPAHRTALGKALLAHTLRDRGAVDRFVDLYGPLRASTPKSITNAAALDRELGATRSRGYAIDDEENEAGVVCIAFPIFLGPPTRPTGAVSVAAIELRTSLGELVARAHEMREVIERRLGSGSVPTIAAVGAPSPARLGG